ncbi:sugar transporter SWEET1-like [Phaethornis superciliosus]
MFGTGLSDLHQMVTTKSVENIQFLPFLSTDVNNLSWLGYGCLKQDWTLIAVNTIGAALQTLFVLVYPYYSPAKGPVLLRCLVLLAVLVAGYSYFTLLIADTGTHLERLGLFCSVFTISMYLSPLADLAKIVRSKAFTSSKWIPAKWACPAIVHEQYTGPETTLTPDNAETPADAGVAEIPD